MCTGLDHDRDLSLVCRFTNCNEQTSDQRFYDSFLTEVIQNYFPNLLVARNHRNQCYALAWGSYVEYHCSEEALELHLALEFFFAT
jgi:hypothetical protein